MSFYIIYILYHCRVPLIIILFLFLWGINVWVLDRFRIQHQPVVKSPASVSFILITSFFLMSVYAVSMTFSSTLLGFSVEFGVTSFYILLTFLAIMPLPGQEARSAFYRLTKTVFFPLNSISFPEVLLADAMTSLSKVFKDICVTFLVVYCYLSGENIIRYHDFGIVAIAILSSLPYA